MLQIHDLSYRHDGAAHTQLAVSAFSLEKGRHAILIGPSGSGKSTLLHLIAAILAPQQGSLIVANTNLATLSARDADAWRGRMVGFLPQRLSLVPSLTARENILLAAYASGTPAEAGHADALLATLGLSGKAGAMPHQLSQGQRQRIALARALFNRPALLLADEPTASLDDENCREAIALLRMQADATGASLVVSTHDARVLHAMPDAQILRLAAPASGELPA